jgi:hypothetical protein
MTLPLVLFVVPGAGFGAVAGVVVAVVAADDLEQRDYSRGRAWWTALGLGAGTLAYFIIVSVAVGIGEFGAR